MVSHGKPLAASMNTKILGSGRDTVVLAHGFGTDQSIWDELIPLLVESNYRVLVFDWAFSGAIEDPGLYDPARHTSYEGFASDLVTLLDEMAVKSVMYMGHSMSGMIGCLASIERPELFQRLVLLCASPRYANTDDYEGGFEASGVKLMISSMESDYAAWASGFPSLIMDPKRPALIDKIRKCYQSMRPEVAVPLAKTVFHSDYRHILENVSVPCHILHTRNDGASPSSVAIYMQGRIRKSTVDIMEIDGHFPQLTAAGQLVAVLRSLLGVASDVAVGPTGRGTG